MSFREWYQLFIADKTQVGGQHNGALRFKDVLDRLWEVAYTSDGRLVVRLGSPSVFDSTVTWTEWKSYHAIEVPTEVSPQKQLA